MKALKLSDRPSTSATPRCSKCLLCKGHCGYLQSVHASSENDPIAAADSLLAYSAQDTACHRYVLESLIELFAEYGPAAALTPYPGVHLDGTDQHLAPRMRDHRAQERAVEVGKWDRTSSCLFPGSDARCLPDITSQTNSRCCSSIPAP